VKLAAAVALVGAGALALAAAPAHAANPPLLAGAGKADITPDTGHYLGGWTRADRIARGQHTRLFARALVLQSGERKVALVAVELFMVGGGMVKHVADRLADRGFTERNLLMTASHTHSGPGGFANFPTLNTAAPSAATITDPLSFYRLLNPEPADPQLYAFLVRQIAAAVERADRDLGPASAGWGSERILGVTRNRSVEAHLANHGVLKAVGEGRDSDDPQGGYVHTIDPDVNVLRIDKRVRRRGRTLRVPIGAFSTFANHGTVTWSSFQYYNADHHASAARVFEGHLRRKRRVPAGQEVVHVFGNSNEGDMSAGLDRHGPAASDFVGRIEAAAMFRAWRRARLERRPVLDLRWTRICFCGQETEGGRVDDHSEAGLPFFTGSEEGRGPLYDVIRTHFEGVTNPFGFGPQAPKASFPAGTIPTRVPLLAVRVGPRLIVTVPGEGTKEVGARLEAAVRDAVAGAGIDEVVVSGLVNEYVLYFTTPEEYDRQHYEGGQTPFGRVSANLLKVEVANLARRLVRGEPAQPPVDFDPTNGVSPDGPPYGDGAARGEILEQPVSGVRRLNRIRMRWQGGPRGLDRPVDRAFLVAERRDPTGAWVRADDDLGLAMRWEVDRHGRYAVDWEIPRDMARGTYRFVVAARRYRLVSRPFEVRANETLNAVRADAEPALLAVSLEYPAAVPDVDLTYRPATAPLHRVRFRVGERVVTVRGGRRHVVFVRAPVGVPVRVEQGDVVDLWGNSNRQALVLR
jgi:neutral ceramidase